LFLFDNLEDAVSLSRQKEKFKEMVVRLLNELRNSTVLISSRVTLDMSETYTEDVIQLQKLDNQVSCQLFEKQMKNTIEHKKLQLLDPKNTLSTKELKVKWQNYKLWELLAGNP